MIQGHPSYRLLDFRGYTLLRARLLPTDFLESKLTPRFIVNVSSGAASGLGQGPYKGSGYGATMYGATKAAFERFTQGLAEEVFQYGIVVTAVAPSRVVPTPGTVYHHLVSGLDDAKSESPDVMDRAILLLATQPFDKISGRVTYSQQI